MKFDLAILWRAIVLAIAALFSITHPAAAQPQAADVSERSREVVVGRSDDGKTLFLIGWLEAGSYFKFARELRSSPKVETVFLASGGGLLMEGFLIGNLVRKHGLKTYVGHYCASACTLVYIAGKKRGIAEHARMGFHQAYIEDENGNIIPDPDDIAYARQIFKAGKIELRPAADSILGLTGNERVIQLFRRANIADDFAQKVLDILPEDMWHPDHEILEEANVINAALPEIALPSEFLLRRQEIVAMMLQNPLWVAAQNTRAEYFNETVDDIWRRANAGVEPVAEIDEYRGELAGKLTAQILILPDDLLQRYMSLYMEFSKYARKTGYKICLQSIKLDELRQNPELVEWEHKEDLLLAEILVNERRQDPMQISKAKKIIKKNAKRIAKTGLVIVDSEPGEIEDCRLGMQTFAALAAIKPKYRLDLYRALMTFGASNQ